MAFTSVEQGKARPPRDENAPSDYLNPGDMVGHLLLVWPVRYERDTYTKYPRADGQPADAVYCDVVDLSVNGEDSQPGKLMRGCKWTQGRLIRDTKGAIGAREPMLIQIGKDGDAYTVIEQMHNPASVQWGEWWMNAHPNFRPGVDQPASVRQMEEQAIREAEGRRARVDLPPQEVSVGVWPPASGPPATPAAPVNATLASLEKSAMDKLREQANRTPPPSTPLPPPPPPAHHADGQPPF